MADRKKTSSRLSILERVTTPLAFFTLGILIIEAILASLSLRAWDTNLTILIVGMLAGFLCLCMMVFVLSAHPRLRHALLGRAETSAARVIQGYGLTPNDIRFLCELRRVSHSRAAEHVLIGETPLPLQARAKKLKQLGLVEAAQYSGHSQDIMLTAEGRELVAVIEAFSNAITELHDRRNN